MKGPNGTKWLMVVLVVGGLAGILWWQRTPLWSWYCVRQLLAAEATTLASWVNRVAALEEDVLPRLLDQLSNSEDKACGNVEAALTALVQRWGNDDARTLALAGVFRSRLGQWSAPGQNAALQVAAQVVGQAGGPLPAPLAQAAVDLLHTAAPLAPARSGALRLACTLLERAPANQVPAVCRTLALQALADAEPGNRIQAINVCLQAARRSGPDLLAKVAPLLHDLQPAVRRAALVALAGAREVVIDDDLLPLLHDSDAEVRRLCETALRSRGLEDHHLVLARLISDPRPTARLQVLQRLQEAPDLEPGVWLQRLSQDPAPAVRAAAIRAAAWQTQVDFRARLQQMAQEDPSPTVRQLAEYYLNRRPLRLD